MLVSQVHKLVKCVRVRRGNIKHDLIKINAANS